MSLPVPGRALLTVALGTLATAGLTACGGSTHAATKAAGATSASPTPVAAPAEPAVATSAITIDNFSFMPPAVTVKSGTPVTWTNNDEEPHSVVSSEEPMRSPTLAGKANTFTHTFARPGTYHYNCGIHPFMHGTVEVRA
jgi:plastocyanin